MEDRFYVREGVWGERFCKFSQTLSWQGFLLCDEWRRVLLGERGAIDGLGV